MTAALSIKQVENVAFRQQSLPTLDLDDIDYSGCAVLVGTETEKVLDVAVKTKTCTPCKRKQPHDKCYANFKGTSGGMEVQGMVEMFARSEEDNIRYTQYIGDGDSAVEAALKNEIRYGSLIDKIDCINHKVKVSLILSR